MNRKIVLSVLLPAAVVALAGASIAAVNTHSAKPQTVVASQDVDWSDSIPYLISHARQGEPWAYEALAECHRQGKGGLKRSFMNAMFYYGLAGKDVFSTETNPGDPFAVFLRLIDLIENEDYDGAKIAIATLNRADYHSADVLMQSISGKKSLTMEEVREYTGAPDTDPDAAVFACVAYTVGNSADSGRKDLTWARPLIMSKIPFMYTLVGMNDFEDARSNDESLQAVKYLLKADEAGALSPQAARLIIRYCEEVPDTARMILSDADRRRILRLAEMKE